MDILSKAKTIVSLREQNERNLQLNAFLLNENDLGFIRKPDESQNFFDTGAFCDTSSSQSNDLNMAAKLIADRNQSVLSYFENFAHCVGRHEIELGWQPRYRSINGYGNNLKNPYWGTPGTPFGRHGPKNYDDGVYSIRKSVTGSELPSPRKLVVDVLLKAEKFPRTVTTPSTIINLLVFYVSHDLAHQVPVKAFENNEKIRCCTSGNKGVLSPSLSHSACLPITISKDDPFYERSGVRCLNMVRSESASLPSTIQYGEVKNKATAFLDHSLIYGIEERQTKRVRTYCQGKLNMGQVNILPVNENGKYIQSSDRLTILSPFGAVWAVIFARNHNNLAERLANLNPHWNDETLFQEARRINIGWYQHGIISGRIIENIFTKQINETYNDNVDPSTTLEFNCVYRFLHYFSQPDIPLVNREGETQSIPISDTFGRIDIIENNYPDIFRGLSAQPLNFGQYTDEVSFNKFFNVTGTAKAFFFSFYSQLFKVVKKLNGIGSDILSLDIQRCK